MIYYDYRRAAEGFFKIEDYLAIYLENQEN